MPNTVRNEAALLALFADNSSGAISEQDARDLIVSVPSLGRVPRTTEATLVLNAANSWNGNVVVDLGLEAGAVGKVLATITAMDEDGVVFGEVSGGWGVEFSALVTSFDSSNWGAVAGVSRNPSATPVAIGDEVRQAVGVMARYLQFSAALRDYDNGNYFSGPENPVVTVTIVVTY